MSAWFKRFGLHLAAAVGATGIFVGAAAVGANQTRQHVASSPTTPAVVRTRTPQAERTRPSVVVSPTPAPTGPTPNAPPPAERVAPERSLAGTILETLPNELDVMGVGGHEWHVVPAPGALIRLNGRATTLDSLQPGDSVVILGQAQAGPGSRFLAHAITVRRK